MNTVGIYTSKKQVSLNTILRVRTYIVALIFLISSSCFTASITQKALTALPALQEDYKSLSYANKVKFLEERIGLSENPVDLYRLHSELVFEHGENDKRFLAHEICKKVPPEDFDLKYRFECLEASEIYHSESIQRLFDLYNDSIGANDNRFAAESLALIAWKQSSKGEISLAFQNFERAMELAENVDIFLLTKITLNLATLYGIHGDDDYIKKGIALKLETIDRLKTLRIEKPDSKNYVNRILPIVYYNLGIAHALHLEDYNRAYFWFDKVPPQSKYLYLPAKIFKSLSALKDNDKEVAQQLLTEARKRSADITVEFNFLKCYMDIVEFGLTNNELGSNCQNINESTPLEVKLDLYSRMGKSGSEALTQSAHRHLYHLFFNVLKPLLKQNSIRSASHAELSRMAIESKMTKQLLEKEKALKVIEKERREDQFKLSVVSILVFILILVIIMNQLRQKRRLAEQFEELSMRDRLTGLNNRLYFDKNIEKEIHFVKRAKQDNREHDVAFFLFDIDHFKKVNDTYGHDVGDKVLVEFSHRLSNTIRESDMLVRWGGEEFLIVTRLYTRENYPIIAERIRQSIADRPFNISDELSLSITCTIGATLYPDVEISAMNIKSNELIQLADIALYFGKNNKRNCWVCIEKFLAPDRFKTMLSQSLEESLSDNLLTVSSSIKELK